MLCEHEDVPPRFRKKIGLDITRTFSGMNDAPLPQREEKVKLPRAHYSTP